MSSCRCARPSVLRTRRLPLTGRLTPAVRLFGDRVQVALRVEVGELGEVRVPRVGLGVEPHRLEPHRLTAQAPAVLDLVAFERDLDDVLDLALALRERA